MAKAPEGGEDSGPNPTDRGQSASKHHVLTDAQGLPLAATVRAAHVHEVTHVFDLLTSMPPVGGKPEPQREKPKRLQGAPGYDSEAVEQPFTLLYGILSLDTGKFRFVSAGHPAPIYLPRDGLPAQLEVTRGPIGVGTYNYEEQAVNLRPGDRLVIYTDGVMETRNADGEHFGSRRFPATLEQTLQSPLGKSLDTLLESIERWCGDTPRHDDISILLIERTDSAGTEGAASPRRHASSLPPSAKS